MAAASTPNLCTAVIDEWQAIDALGLEESGSITSLAQPYQSHVFAIRLLVAATTVHFKKHTPGSTGVHLLKELACTVDAYSMRHALSKKDTRVALLDMLRINTSSVVACALRKGNISILCPTIPVVVLASHCALRLRASQSTFASAYALHEEFSADNHACSDLCDQVLHVHFHIATRESVRIADFVETYAEVQIAEAARTHPSVQADLSAHSDRLYNQITELIPLFGAACRECHQIKPSLCLSPMQSGTPNSPHKPVKRKRSHAAAADEEAKTKYVPSQWQRDWFQAGYHDYKHLLQQSTRTSDARHRFQAMIDLVQSCRLKSLNHGVSFQDVSQTDKDIISHFRSGLSPGLMELTFPHLALCCRQLPNADALDTEELGTKMGFHFNLRTANVNVNEDSRECKTDINCVNSYLCVFGVTSTTAVLAVVDVVKARKARSRQQRTTKKLEAKGGFVFVRNATVHLIDADDMMAQVVQKIWNAACLHTESFCAKDAIDMALSTPVCAHLQRDHDVNILGIAEHLARTAKKLADEMLSGQSYIQDHRRQAFMAMDADATSIARTVLNNLAGTGTECSTVMHAHTDAACLLMQVGSTKQVRHGDPHAFKLTTMVFNPIKQILMRAVVDGNILLASAIKQLYANEF